MAPAISVLMPAYDAALTLASALLSVQRQTERDWECVVVDDGSTDRTQEIVAAFAREDARVRLVACEHRGKPGLRCAARRSLLASTRTI